MLVFFGATFSQKRFLELMLEDARRDVPRFTFKFRSSEKRNHIRSAYETQVAKKDTEVYFHPYEERDFPFSMAVNGESFSVIANSAGSLYTGHIKYVCVGIILAQLGGQPFSVRKRFSDRLQRLVTRPFKKIINLSPKKKATLEFLDY